VRAVTWHGRRDVRVEEVPDPRIEAPTDAIVQVTASGLCGSDLHLYEVLAPFMTEGDVLGHEPMGIVEEVGSEVTNLRVGDRVVIPFNIACGRCFMCERGLPTQCETTQVREHDKGAALFGYTKLYGQVPGGQAEYLRVPQAQYGPIVVPHGPPDDRFLYLSDVLPTAWQAVRYADVPEGGSLLVIGLGPIGEMCVRIARHLGIDPIIAVESVPDRRERGRVLGARVLDPDQEDLLAEIRDVTADRGPDSVVDAVGMEAHGAPLGTLAHRATALLPDAVAEPLMTRAGVDRLSALHLAIDAVRRGGTISVVGVYGGQLDPFPMMTAFDKGLTLRMGQANVRRWVDDLLPLVLDEDVLGVERFASHRVSLEEAPEAYRRFQEKRDGTFKVVFRPSPVAGRWVSGATARSGAELEPARPV
jgi:threonine dehydrogenase-like Zn-dependent dehydrogenase